MPILPITPCAVEKHIPFSDADNQLGDSVIEAVNGLLSMGTVCGGGGVEGCEKMCTVTLSEITLITLLKTTETERFSASAIKTLYEGVGGWTSVTISEDGKTLVFRGGDD